MESEASYPIVAGIVGQSHMGEISNCYNTGRTSVITTITDTIVNGGIIGYCDNGTTIKNNYWLSTYSPSGIAQLDEGTTGNYEAIEILSEEEMQKMATNLGNDYKQDTRNINKGYPILNWQ